MRVFKFYDAQSALLNISQRRLKISTIGDLNDPYEFNAIKFNDKKSRLIWAQERKSIFQSRGIICFCKNWRNPVVWSHYADKHRGLALGFEIPNDELLPVEYSSNRIDFDEYFPDPNRQVSNSVDLVLQAMRTKFTHWQYEQEMRLIAELGEPDKNTGLFFREFDEKLVLREVVIGPLSKVSSLDIRNAFGANRPLSVITSRLAFQSFEVVKQKSGSRQR